MVEFVVSPSEAHLLFDRVIKMAEPLKFTLVDMKDAALRDKLNEAEEALKVAIEANGTKGGVGEGLLRAHMELRAVLFELWDKTRKQKDGDQALAQEYFERMKEQSDIIDSLKTGVRKLPVIRYR